MEKQRTSPRKKNTAKPVLENEHSASDDECIVLVKDTKRAKKLSKRTRGKKVKSYEEPKSNESSSEEDVSVLSKNSKGKGRAKHHTPDKNDSTTVLKEHEQNTGSNLNLSDASSDDIFSPSKNQKAISVSIHTFDSLLSNDNKGKSMCSDSSGKKQPENSRRKERVNSESHEQGTSEKDESTLNKHNATKVSGTKSESCKLSPSKTVKKTSGSSPRHSSSDEEDSLPTEDGDTKKRATRSSEKSESNVVKAQSEKDKISGKRKAAGSSDADTTSPSKAKASKATKNVSDKPLSTDVAVVNQESSEVMPVIEKECDDAKAFSDQEDSSMEVPDIDKVFETLEEETARESRNKLFFEAQRSRSPSPIKMTPEKKDEGTKSDQKKIKTTHRSENSELNKTSLSEDKEPEHSRSEHDKSSNSTSKENDSAVAEDVESDKIETPVSDLGVKKASRGRPKKHLSHCNASSNKTSSALSEEPSEGEKNGIEKEKTSDSGNSTPSKDEENRTEKETTSDSAIKKPRRGRPRKSELPAIPEQNGKLPSKDRSNSEAGSSPSKTKESEMEENKSRQYQEKANTETSNTAKETTSYPQPESTPRVESSPVYAVKSKPSSKKRKSDESAKKAKTQGKTEKHSGGKSSKAASKADASPVSDKNCTLASKSSLKEYGGTARTKAMGEKRKAIYTSSDDSDSEAEAMSPKVALDAKGKKIKREFSCHKCNTKFARTQQLFDHICEGKRDKGFACERCDKIYKLRSTYINHKIIHSRKKPYKCGLCGKKSASQSNHLYHMKNSHPGCKPFPCEFFPCEKSFTTRKDQTDHHKKHKRFICPYCDEVFAKDSTLLHHKYKVHEVFFS